MKTITRWIMSMIIVGSVGGSILTIATPSVTFAATDCDSGFLTFPTWYRGLADPENDCNITSPTQEGLPVFIRKIVFNVIEMALQVVGYISAFLILRAGYKFITRSDEASEVAAAKSTIANALTGLVISIASVAIVKLAEGIIIGSTTGAKVDVDGELIDVGVPVITADLVLKNGLNIFYYLMGSIAVIMLIKAGLTYVTSGGDSSNLIKAKNIMLYSIIGLITIVLAFVITSFVVGSF